MYSPSVRSLLGVCLRAHNTTLCSSSRSYAVDLSHAVVVDKTKMREFMVRCMTSVKCDVSHAEQLADVLLAGDQRGHYSHGLNRLGMYVNDIGLGVCAGSGAPAVLSDWPSTAWVDGHNLLGPVVGNFCTDLAIEKAEKTGVGWVTSKGSNHFGIAAWYPLRAVERGMIGLSFTNTSPISFPTRAAKASLGTNPMCVAAPGQAGDAFVLDMATTAVAVGKVEIADRTGQKQLPRSWAVDGQGRETRDPKVALSQGGLYPLGGAEITSGYKGYGLAAMVELFCGMLADAAWGPHVRKWMNTDRDANLGQCFVAINPAAFAPGFSERVQLMMDTLRALPTVEGSEPVLVAGDPERQHLQRCQQLGGIPYHPSQIEYADALADKCGIERLVVQKS